MSTQHLEVIETTVHKTHQWIDRLADDTGMAPHAAYQVLRAVLHTLRDRLPTAEAAHLAAQLPILIRGLFYEGWIPAITPVLFGSEEFLYRVSKSIGHGDPIAPLDSTKSALRVMNHFLGAGELDKISAILPRDIRTLFPLDCTKGKAGTSQLT